MGYRSLLVHIRPDSVQFYVNPGVTGHDVARRNFCFTFLNMVVVFGRLDGTR